MTGGSLSIDWALHAPAVLPHEAEELEEALCAYVHVDGWMDLWQSDPSSRPNPSKKSYPNPDHVTPQTYLVGLARELLPVVPQLPAAREPHQLLEGQALQGRIRCWIWSGATGHSKGAEVSSHPSDTYNQP